MFSCFPLHLFSALPRFLRALQRNRAQSRLLCLLIKILSGIHKGVESPSDGISIGNNKKKSGSNLIKEGDLNDPGQNDDEEKNGKICRQYDWY